MITFKNLIKESDFPEDERLNHYDDQYKLNKTKEDFKDEVNGFFLNAKFIQDALNACGLSAKLAQRITILTWKKLIENKTDRGKIEWNPSKSGFTFEDIYNMINTISEDIDEIQKTSFDINEFYKVVCDDIWSEVQNNYE